MGSETVRAIRGATTVDRDEAIEIIDRTNELLSAMVAENGLRHDQIISILFTATQDLVSVFPARAARLNGFSDIPLLDAQEIPVPGSLPRCIRVMMHLTTEKSRDEMRHVYLHDAKGLRDDTPK
jgi:chorismate mutase